MSEKRLQAADLQRMVQVELATISAWRDKTWLTSPETRDRTRLWDVYKTILKQAHSNPSFSLRKTLGVFRHLALADPELSRQINEDYNELSNMGVENPFHHNNSLTTKMDPIVSVKP